ncbi:hypothetical protein M5E06_17775 [Azospirillum sp. A1-3]|uniref:hypothetical protein n=1 Tax=Azospirillum sp. A1-3 TaxID=185874 RepID=UPI0020779AE5|nr:hypothetical protein [Azospirillum sp. A1-3]MCM8735985.1 hypothetical protein [Azospirillum sp. A1-3]
MTSIKVGASYVDKVTGYAVTVTEVTERDIWLRFDFGDGKCGTVIGRDHATDTLIEYKPPQD